MDPKPFSSGKKTFVRHFETFTLIDDVPTNKRYSLIWTDGDDHYVRIRVAPEVYLAEDVDLERLSEEAVLVPRTYYRPVYPGDLVVAPVPPSADSFLKIFMPNFFVPGEDEGETLLADHPHPNIGEYRGCILAHGRIKGLCFKRYGTDLYCAKRDGYDFDADRVMEGLRAGLAHLHGLGYIHNDLNPSNVVLDSDGQAVIVDFGSCVPKGEPMTLSLGTPPWTNGAEIASEENDFYGLEKIDDWIRQPRSPRSSSEASDSGTDDCCTDIPHADTPEARRSDDQ
ncbi:kinase-like domain-containing protein [Amylostereum chailletii]|nr:kinase-like domain-containing protein [Amylostereum chailletii]